MSERQYVNLKLLKEEAISLLRCIKDDEDYLFETMSRVLENKFKRELEKQTDWKRFWKRVRDGEISDAEMEMRKEQIKRGKAVI